MPWLQIKARISDTEAPLMEHLFQSLGAVSVTLLDAEDEPVFQLDSDSTPLWQQVLLSALFEHDAPAHEIVATITAMSRLQDQDLLIEHIADQDWERAWMDEFKPMRFGRRLWVCPSWCPPPEADAVNLMLDPGLAFGSGTHPTTALCLEWLDAQALTGKRVIDYGCGSGILAIAAILLGADHVIAVDNDPQAITACANNREMNAIAEHRLSVHLPGEPHRPADVVIANILSGPLAELTPVLTGLTRPGGKLVLSGVLSAQTEALLASYRPWFQLREPIVRDEWVLIEGTRLQTPPDS
jgi:ribosomal protein L11 methyltransferase